MASDTDAARLVSVSETRAVSDRNRLHYSDARERVSANENRPGNNDRTREAQAVNVADQNLAASTLTGEFNSTAEPRRSGPRVGGTVNAQA